MLQYVNSTRRYKNIQKKTHSRKAPAVELSPNELKDCRIEKFKGVELSKKMIFIKLRELGSCGIVVEKKT